MKQPEIVKLTKEEIDQLFTKLDECSLPEDDSQLLKGILKNHLWLNDLLLDKNISMKRLKNLFGIKTESSKQVLKEIEEGFENPEPDDKESEDKTGKPKSKPKKKGHGRNGKEAYTGAKQHNISHETLKVGGNCPDCGSGRLYQLKESGIVIKVYGGHPIDADLYNLEKLRCSSCQSVFTATPPPEAGDEKYNAEAGAMIALMRYGCGFPNNRLAQLQKDIGIPLPSSTQWDIVLDFHHSILPVYNQLINLAAQGNVLHNDDTKARILALIQENKKSSPKRKGIFTTGIFSTSDDYQIVLYFTSRKHAGENLQNLLVHREQGKDPPIQMCDSLSRNLVHDYAVTLANCLVHARRKFVELYSFFPEECRTVIEIFRQVYKNEKTCRERKLTDEQRLEYHQKNSGPQMDKLKEWCDRQFQDNLVEPNSSLGKSIEYIRKHWKEFTTFLRVPGAPLDNNILERNLKLALLHRKNSLFFKTERGAFVGDIFMSIIATCRIALVNPLRYLALLHKNAERVKAHPELWLPWNYQEALPNRSHVFEVRRSNAS